MIFTSLQLATTEPDAWRITQSEGVAKKVATLRRDAQHVGFVQQLI